MPTWPNEITLHEARKVARAELDNEMFQSLVRAERERILAAQSRRRWWHRFIPFTITITRRKP